MATYEAFNTMAESEHENRERDGDMYALRPNTIRWVAGIVFGLSLAVSLWFVVAYYNSIEGVATERSEFAYVGDYFGGTLGVFLVLLTVLVVAISLWQSSEVLRLTRRTYEQTRDEAKSARQQVDESTRALGRQVYSTSVTQLIDIRKDAVSKVFHLKESIEDVSGTAVVKPITGEDSLPGLVHHIEEEIEFLANQEEEPTNDVLRLLVIIHALPGSGYLLRFHEVMSATLEATDDLLLDENDPLLMIYNMSLSNYEKALAFLCAYAFGKTGYIERLGVLMRCTPTNVMWETVPLFEKLEKARQQLEETRGGSAYSEG